MTVVLPAPAMCSTSGHAGSPAPLHGAAAVPGWPSKRRGELVECFALSLVLHAVLLLWASAHSPALVERAHDDVVEDDAPTFSIATVLSRPPVEEPIQQPEEAPLLAEPPDVPLEPVPVLAAAPPPPAAERAEVSVSPPPPPLGAPLAEPPHEPVVSAASPPPSHEPPPSVPDTKVAEAVDEPPPASEAAAEEAQPMELGTPEGNSDEPPPVAPVEPSPELARSDEVAAAPEPESGGAEADAHAEPVLELPAPRMEGTGAGNTAPATPAAPAALAPTAPPRPAEAPPARNAGRTLASCQQDEALMAQARAELAGGARKGLTTVLLAAPEDQLEIARFFSEEVVLVPRTTLDAGAAPRYYRLAPAGPSGVEVVASAPPLEGHRQYRDLFDYEYSRLPASLRDLRRAVPAREDVYLFAALLSPPEWALVIARRQEALARTGRDLSSVRQFVLRYVRAPGGFDLRVAEIVFSDGTRVRSGETEQGAR